MSRSALSSLGLAIRFGAGIVIGLALSSSAFAATRGQPTNLDVPPTLRIVAFGSSSTEGIGATSPAWTYPAQLQAMLARLLPHGRHVEVLNRGIGGEDADDMVKRLQKDVIARRPDVVIWQTGSNDPLRHVPLDRFDQETRDGVAAMRRAGIEVILMEPQWCPRIDAVKGSVAYRDVIRRIGLDTHIDVVRRSDLMHEWIHEGLLKPAQMLAGDGLHMTDGGYTLLARSVAPEVLKVEDIHPILETSVVR